MEYRGWTITQHCGFFIVDNDPDNGLFVSIEEVKAAIDDDAKARKEDLRNPCYS